MMRISRSTTSQRCSIGWRSGDCGGHLSKVNSFHVQETSLRWFELCNMVHYPAGSSIRRWVHGVIKGWRLNNAQLVLRGPKCAKKMSSTPSSSAWTVETKQDGSMHSWSLRQFLTLPSECRSRNRDWWCQQVSAEKYWCHCSNNCRLQW